MVGTNIKGVVGDTAVADSASGGGGGNNGTELIEIITSKVEKVSEELETIKSHIAKQERKVDKKLEKAISDLPYMKFVILLLLHILLLRNYLY